jgi:hypothetical protein
MAEAINGLSLPRNPGASANWMAADMTAALRSHFLCRELVRHPLFTAANINAYR